MAPPGDADIRARPGDVPRDALLGVSRHFDSTKKLVKKYQKGSQSLYL